ncbi:MAG: protein kinase [Chloroflexota bacterium]
MSANDLSGKTLGAYQLRERLWNDEYGTTYRAFQTDIEREVALKVTQVDVEADPTALTRFHSEAKILASLDHPNIAPIYSSGVEDRRGYIAMRLLKGGTLAERVNARLEARSAPPVQEITEQMLQVADALDYAHSQGVLHRAISPNNLMFDHRQKLYVTNFSVARILSGATMSNTVMIRAPKLPPFWSPERWIGELLTDKMDQFSFAATLYFCLVGRIPFVDLKSEKLATEYIGQRLVPMSVLEGFSPALQEVFRRAFARMPEDRYPNVTAMAQAFQAASDGTANNLPATPPAAPAPRPPAPDMDDRTDVISIREMTEHAARITSSALPVAPTEEVAPAPRTPEPAPMHPPIPINRGQATNLDDIKAVTPPVTPPIAASRSAMSGDVTDLDFSPPPAIGMPPASYGARMPAEIPQESAPEAAISSFLEPIGSRRSKFRRWKRIAAIVDVGLAALLAVLFIIPRSSAAPPVSTNDAAATAIPTDLPTSAPSDSGGSGATSTVPPTVVPPTIVPPPQVELLRNLVLRAGPGGEGEYDRAGDFPQGALFDILGISENGSWYFVQTSDGTRIWVTTSPVVVKTHGDAGRVPVVPPPTKSP